MWNQILIPLDGSQLSEEALGPGLELARRAAARPHIVVVHEPVPPGVASDFDPGSDHDYREQLRAYLEAITAELDAGEGPEPVARLREGPAAAELLAHIEEESIDAVVMASHGRGGLERLWLGSAADRLVRSARVPILLIRPGARGPDEHVQLSDLEHILVPLDGSELAEHVLEPATTLGALAGARYTLLRVLAQPLIIGSAFMPYPAVPEPELNAERRGAAEAYLEAIAEQLRAGGATVETRLDSHQSVPRAIIEHAEDLDADMVALATHARRGLSRAFLGSVADKVIRKTILPLLIFRPPED